VDPHGDPIPDASGKLREIPLVAVAQCKPGAHLRLARVLDQRAEFLQFLDRNALRIDSTLRNCQHRAGAGTITIHVDGGVRVALSEAAAANLLVEPVAEKR